MMQARHLAALAVVLAAALASPVLAQDGADGAGEWFAPLKGIPIGPGTLDVGLNVRVRLEHSDNTTIKTYGTEAQDDVLALRTQLGFDYHVSADAHVYVLFQDSRFWLSDLEREDFPASCPYYDQFDVRQAYVAWRHVGGSVFGFTLGRQAISYADKRVFGPSGWGNVGKYWWDAAKVTVDTEPVQVDVLYGMRVVSEQTGFNDTHDPYDMYAVYAQFKVLPCKLDAFYALRDEDDEVEGESGPGDAQRHTLGVYADGTSGAWDYRGTLAVQVGSYGEDDIEALGANARVGYTFDSPWKPRAGIEFNYASGDDDPDDGTNGTFDGVFGAVPPFYGRMNLVSWSNLEDYQLSFSVKPAKTVTVALDHHILRLASAEDNWYWCNNTVRRAPTEDSGDELGQETDLTVKYAITENLELFAGYAHFFAGTFVERTPGNGDDADWAFVQLTYSF